MNARLGFDRCLNFINCNLQPAQGVWPIASPEPRRAVTISRLPGSGGHEVAAHLAELLQREAPVENRPWTVFDRNLVGKVLEDNHLPSRLEQFMPEDRVRGFTDTMDELFGLHPPSWILVRRTSETILRLAEMGSVILIGRGANLITRNLNHVFHVRLVGSLEKRVKYIQDRMQLNAVAAREFVVEQSAARARYIKHYFKCDINDPLLYHLIINTDHVPYEIAARLIVDAMLHRVPANGLRALATPS